jgi:hypothetical protein
MRNGDDSSINLALTEILRESWRTHAWEGSPPPPFRNIQYIATALFVLRMKGLIDGTDPAPAVEILATQLPHASRERSTSLCQARNRCSRPGPL